MLTPDAARFVGPLTFEALCGRRIPSDLWTGDDPLVHTRLGKWADLVLVAPATATTMAKAACGLADDLVSAVVLSTESSVAFAPALHKEMWNAPATRRNVGTLRSMGMSVMDPPWGELAGHDEGPGRFPEIDDVVAFAELVLHWRERTSDVTRSIGTSVPEVSLEGRRVLVTAGGTREPIDPVRFVSNRSSGKMGRCLAIEAWLRGAEVVVVSTVDMEPRGPRFGIRSVETAEEMHEAVLEEVPRCDVLVMAAAVADFRPKDPAKSKIKKDTGAPTVVFEPTIDILGEVGRNRGASGRPRVVVGFAAETEDVVANAQEKARRKNVDLVVANEVSRPDSGFGSDTNLASLVHRDGSVQEFPLMHKRALARLVWDRVEELLVAAN